MSWSQLPRPARRRTSWGSTAAIIGALAVVAGALLIVPGMLAPQPTARPHGSEDGTQSASAATSTAAILYRTVAWEIRPLNVSSENLLYRLLRLGDRLILVGEGRTGLGAWYSDDEGGSWKQTVLSGEEAPQDGAVPHIGRVAVRETRLVASGGWTNQDGSESLASFLLVSDDSGTSWRSVPVPAQLEHTEFDQILGTTDRFVAHGFGLRDGTQGWWESTDGITWAPAPVIGFPEGQPPSDMAAGPLGNVAAGSHFSGNSSLPAIWWSDDAHSWTSVLEPGDLAFGFVFGVAAGQPGFAAAGSTWADAAGDMDAGKATLWRSGDGRTWTSLITSDDPGRRSGSVAINDAGVVAALIEPNSAALPDEQLVFIPHDSDEISRVDAPIRIQEIVAASDRFIALGRCQDSPTCTENYLVIGTPSEATQVPALELPPD